MTDTEPKLPLPNPGDWTDTAGAAAILGKSRPTVYEMCDRGVIERYRIGTHAMFWVPQLEQVAAAIRKLARRAAIR